MENISSNIEDGIREIWLKTTKNATSTRTLERDIWNNIGDKIGVNIAGRIHIVMIVSSLII